jgi:hypothetical protein
MKRLHHPRAREVDVYERVALPTLIAILLAAAFLLFDALSARAQDSTVPRLRDRLALALAVVAAHEGALDNVNDTNLIWQVVEGRAKTIGGRLAFLRAHSPRALGIEPCNGGNCAWSVELLSAPDATPTSVDAGYWRKVRAEQWDLVRRRARGLVYGIDTERPCAGAVYSWGGSMDVQSAYRDRGLVPLGCEGVANDGFAPAPKTISADDACGPKCLARRGARRAEEAEEARCTSPAPCYVRTEDGPEPGQSKGDFATTVPCPKDCASCNCLLTECQKRCMNDHHDDQPRATACLNDCVGVAP